MTEKSKGINEFQFGFKPGCGTTNPIFIIHRSQEKYIVKGILYFVFDGLERYLIVGLNGSWSMKVG